MLISPQIQQKRAASQDAVAAKTLGRRAVQEKATLRAPKSEIVPSAPPPTLEKPSSSLGYLDKIASQVLRKTLNFAPPADRNALALNQVSAKLAAAVEEQSQGAESYDLEQMRKVPIVNEDLAAKLARRRGWEAEEEAKKMAAQAAAQLLENERKQHAIQQRNDETAKQAARQAEEQRALQRERELQIQQEIEAQMEQSVETKAKDARNCSEQQSDLPPPCSDMKRDDEMEKLIAARKAAEAAAQLASLERQEIERRISVREQEKSKLRQARKRLEDEVRKAAEEAKRSEQPLRKSTPAVLSTEEEKSTRKASGRSSDTLVPPLKLSKLTGQEPAKASKPVLENFASMQAAASIATAAAAAAAAAQAEQPRSLKVDGKLSDILSGIDKLLRGEKKPQQEAEMLPPGIFSAPVLPKLASSDARAKTSVIVVLRSHATSRGSSRRSLGRRGVCRPGKDPRVLGRA